MNASNLYRKIKQILDDSNIALVNKGFEEVSSLYEIPREIKRYGKINRFPHLYGGIGVELTLEDFDGMASIRQYLFNGCLNLIKATIPSSITTIDAYAFNNCTNLTDIYLYPTTPPSLGNTTAIPNTTTIHVPIGSGDAYKAATNWSYHSSRIVEDIEIE